MLYASRLPLCTARLPLCIAQGGTDLNVGNSHLTSSEQLLARHRGEGLQPHLAREPKLAIVACLDGAGALGKPNVVLSKL